VRASVLLPLALCAALFTAPRALATAKHTVKTHVVCSGQRLDSIAKQYGVSTAELRRANDLRPGAGLKIGQRLTIPSRERSDDEGERERPIAEKAKPASASMEQGKPAILKASLSTRATAPLRHRVLTGETLAQIAARYGTSVAALSASNGLEKARPVRAGQMLTLPSGVKAVLKSWAPYAKPPKRKGTLDVSTPIAHFSGPVLDSDGRLRPIAVRALNELLGAGGAHPALPERLIRLLVEVSDTFAGRPIRLVSGYRNTSYFQDSKHKLSSAVDFLVLGVPNAAVCEYLRELEDVGVGYYPNSSFVHLDVRGQSAFWVDYAGPGEPPRSTPNAPREPRAPRGADRKLFAELERLFKQAKGAIADAGARKEQERPSQPTPEREGERDDNVEASPPNRGEPAPGVERDEM
jgi:LysM repeat protein